MKNTVQTVDEYIKNLPDKHKQALIELRNIINKNLPEGYEETMQYGMITYVVPLYLYPSGYRGNRDTPLPFISIASQKHHIAIYHMGIYVDADLSKWFETEFRKLSQKKLDMGKSCIRFKKPEDIPIDLIGKLVTRMTPARWIEIYELSMNKRK